MFRSGFVLLLNLLLVLKVCALPQPTTSKRLQKCQVYNDQVYGGRSCVTTNTIHSTTIQEFPHIAILGYRDNEKNLNHCLWNCHGTLISSRYVLTIAHCLTNSHSALVKVRFGEVSSNFSDAFKPTDYDVERVILHPLYKPKNIYNHIGLIKLAQKVKFSENVRPICLPDTDLSSNIVYQVKYEALIGGQQSFEHRALKKYESVLVAKDKCNEKYFYFPIRRIPNGITDDLMCIKKTSPTENNVGGSGAPIYVDHPHIPCSHVQLGIVSVGHRNDDSYPEIGTKVFNFSDWIESIIWAAGEDV